MSTESTYTKKANEIVAPTAGNVSVYAGSTTATTQNLALCGAQTLNMAIMDQLPASSAFGPGASLGTLGGLLDGYADFYADGVDIGVVFGPNASSVSGNNAPNLSVTGTNTTGTNGATCVRIPSGTFRSYYIHPGTVWVGYVASSNAGFLRIAPSSRRG